MSKPKPVTKPWEVRFALTFLKALGASTDNVYLLLAIIAWMRSEGGSQLNPLNVPHGKYRTAYLAAVNSAKYLMAHKAQYATILAAVKRGSGNTAAEMQQQAMDVLTAVAMDEWDGHFYGTRESVFNRRVGEYVETAFDNTKNVLLQVWMKLLGHPVNIPQDPVTPPKVATPKNEPRGRVIPIPKRDYLQPNAARAFYEERHKPIPNRPGDPAAAYQS